MTAQQIFDKVCEHLAKQGCRAVLENGVACEYRMPDGRMCAVGVLIPKRVSSRLLIGTSDALIEDHSDVLPKYFQTHRDLLRQLQVTHDTAERKGIEGGRRIAADLRGVAKDFYIDPAKAALLETVDWKG